MPTKEKTLRAVLITVTALLVCACGMNIVGLVLNPPQRSWWTITDNTANPPRYVRTDYNPRFNGFSSFAEIFLRIPRDLRLHWINANGIMVDGFPQSLATLGVGPDIPMLIVCVAVNLAIATLTIGLLRKAARTISDARGFDVLPPPTRNPL